MIIEPIYRSSSIIDSIRKKMIDEWWEKEKKLLTNGLTLFNSAGRKKNDVHIYGCWMVIMEIFFFCRKVGIYSITTTTTKTTNVLSRNFLQKNGHILLVGKKIYNSFLHARLLSIFFLFILRFSHLKSFFFDSKKGCRTTVFVCVRNPHKRWFRFDYCKQSWEAMQIYKL